MGKLNWDLNIACILGIYFILFIIISVSGQVYYTSEHHTVKDENLDRNGLRRSVSWAHSHIDGQYETVHNGQMGMCWCELIGSVTVWGPVPIRCG